MGLPQPLIDALQDIETAERLRPMERLREGTEASLGTWLRGFREVVGKLEKSSERIKETGKAVLQRIEGEISSGSPSQELDQVINWLLEREEELRRHLPLEMELIGTLKAGTFSFPIAASDKAPLVSACERYIKARQSILKTLRDLRWDLMALRAEAEDPGDAPVFDNPQDLLDYLKTSSK
jgi:hypothetical protein